MDKPAEDHRDGSIEAGYDSKETKRQIEDESDKILKRKRVASREDEVDAREAKRKRKDAKREKKKAEKTAKERKDCGDPVEYVVANTKVTGQPTNAIRGGANGECSTAISSVCLISLHFLLSLTSLRSHRARNIASKRLAAASAKGMNEILGIASSASADQTGIFVCSLSRSDSTAPPSIRIGHPVGTLCWSPVGFWQQFGPRRLKV